MIDNICTQGYHIIEDFLDTNHYQGLRSYIQQLSEKGMLRTAKIGQKIDEQHNRTIRTDNIYWIDEEPSNPDVQNYIQNTTQLAQIFNQALFLNLVEFEAHFAMYLAGAFYKKHVDQFAKNKDRAISFVYYLNQDWQDEYGGELKLYNQEDQLLLSLSPQGNRFICFKSDLPHEVCITHQPRYSIAGWMKTRSSVFVANQMVIENEESIPA